MCDDAPPRASPRARVLGWKLSHATTSTTGRPIRVASAGLLLRSSRKQDPAHHLDTGLAQHIGRAAGIAKAGAPGGCRQHRALGCLAKHLGGRTAIRRWRRKQNDGTGGWKFVVQIVVSDGGV